MYIQNVTVAPTNGGFKGHAIVAVGSRDLRVEIEDFSDSRLISELGIFLNVGGHDIPVFECGNTYAYFSGDTHREKIKEFHEDFGIDLYQLFVNLHSLMEYYLIKEADINRY